MVINVTDVDIQPHAVFLEVDFRSSIDLGSGRYACRRVLCVDVDMCGWAVSLLRRMMATVIRVPKTDSEILNFFLSFLEHQGRR